MKRVEIEKLVDERVGASVAHAFGLMKEYLIDQFKLVSERFDIMQESMDRQFAEVRADIAALKIDVGVLKMGEVSVDARIRKLEKTKRTY